MGRSIAKANPQPGDEEMPSDEWCTPPEVADPLFDFWGVCGDPCSNERSVVRAHTRYTWGGLHRPWWEETYANWPYSKNEPWSGKAVSELGIGRVRELAILCMTATSTGWWRGLMVKPRRNPRVIMTKRIKFLGPDRRPVDSSRFEPALIYYGARAAAFDRQFSHLAMWSTWGR